MVLVSTRTTMFRRLGTVRVRNLVPDFWPGPW